MKVAVLTPSHVPFARGGLEKHALELAKYGEVFGGHAIESINVPTPENSVEELLGSYKLWWGINLDHFDAVVSLKYPTWAVNHRGHILWLTSKLRGLYDLYDLRMSEIDKDVRNEIDAWFVKMPLLVDSDRVVEVIDGLLSFYRANRDREGFGFPGYFIKKAVEYLDFILLSPKRFDKFYTNSNNVKNREDYFYWRSLVQPLYPPLFVDGDEVAKCRKMSVTYEDIYLVVGRLSPEKRVDLIINAFKRTKVKSKLVICGDGPSRVDLEKLSVGDRRVEIKGFVSEDEKTDFYCRAKAVIYAPKDEDYGYITGEAYRHKKPILTTVDSGGVCELVRNEKNGFVVDPGVVTLASVIERADRDRMQLKNMGESGFEDIVPLTWENTIKVLLPKTETFAKTEGVRKKIWVLTTYRVYPAESGGQLRVWNLYRHLTDKYDVYLVNVSEQVSLGVGSVIEEKLGEHIYQITVVIDDNFKDKFWKLQAKFGEVPIFDLACLKYVDELVGLKELFNKRGKEIDYLVVSHPYLYFDDIKSYLRPETKLVFEEHNLEWRMKKEYVNSRELVNLVKLTEEKLSQQADLVVFASRDIAKELHLQKKVSAYVPNGFDFDGCPRTSYDDRQRFKARLNIRDSVALFVGSYHPPNIRAVEFICKLAKSVVGKNWLFVVVGSVGNYYGENKLDLPENVLVLGRVDEERLWMLMSVADVAINPMFSGGGSNIKMITFAAAGLPVVSSEIGNRDFAFGEESILVANNLKEFGNAMALLVKSEARQVKMSEKMYMVAKSKYDWKTLSGKLSDILEKI